MIKPFDYGNSSAPTPTPIGGSTRITPFVYAQPSKLSVATKSADTAQAASDQANSFSGIVKNTASGVKDIAGGIVGGILDMYRKPDPRILATEKAIAPQPNPNDGPAFNTLTAPARAAASLVQKAVLRTLGSGILPFSQDVTDSYEAGKIADQFHSGVLDSKQTINALNNLETLHKTTGQYAGDILQVALTAGAPTYAGEGVAESAIAPTLRTALAQGTLHGTQAGAAFGLAQALSSGSHDPVELAKIVVQNTAGGALLGLITTGVVKVSEPVLARAQAVARDVAKISDHPLPEAPTVAPFDYSQIDSSHTIANGDKPAPLDTLHETGGVPSPITASKPSEAVDTSIGSAPIGKEGVSAPKADTSGPFEGDKLYHGTATNFDTFKLQPNKMEELGPGVYFYTDKGKATGYAGKDGRVVETAVPSGKFASKEDFRAARDAANKDGFNLYSGFQEAVKRLQQQGFVGIKDGDIVNVFDPKSIKPSPSIPKEGGTPTGDTPFAQPTEGAPKPIKGNEAFTSRVFERMKSEHPELTGDATAEHIKLQEDATKAVDLIATDKQKAFRIAMGHETSGDVTSTAVNIAMAEKALADGNTTLASRLIRNRALEQTRRGQELVAERGSVTDNSTSKYVKDLVASRLENLGKKYLSGLTNKVVGTTDKGKAMKALDGEVVKVEKQIKMKKLDVKSALSLLDKIACV